MKQKKLTIIEYAKILDQLLKGSPDIDDTLDVFVSFLAKNEVINMADSILDAFILLNDSRLGRSHIVIKSRDILDPQIQDEIADSLNAVQVKTVIDKEIIGGVKVETQDVLYDLTINAQIKKLKQYLIEE